MLYSTFWLIFAEETEGGLFDFNATCPLMALQFLGLMVDVTRGYSRYLPGKMTF